MQVGGLVPQLSSLDGGAGRGEAVRRENNGGVGGRKSGGGPKPKVFRVSRWSVCVQTRGSKTT